MKYCAHCYRNGAATENPNYHQPDSPGGLCPDPLSIRGECECGKANDGHQYLPKPDVQQATHQDWIDYGESGPITERFIEEDETAHRLAALVSTKKEDTE